jgi:hypothetical protein
MNFRNVIARSRRRGTTGDVARSVNAAVAANVGEPGPSPQVSSGQRIVQREERTEVTTDKREVKGGSE